MHTDRNKFWVYQVMKAYSCNLRKRATQLSVWGLTNVCESGQANDAVTSAACGSPAPSPLRPFHAPSPYLSHTATGAAPRLI